ncbi:hypothetical protein AN191_08685 [Loktanella sp. 5RATIMAR09]|uniref:hypothetical protein n=1 Tax=Loktanella sp. 5RATIMAR09 TaxID=1225655 RepID=UPI0006EB3496|nr:hypothetical protein [Loktanella sp. 5RATIMAR09]KQI72200.1 hypothetical protein AN191_08685 [Loktanella sp. 5RATIMAR09]
MDEYDYSDFDWDIQPNDVYDIVLRDKIVREFKIEKSLALECFSHLESAALFSTLQHPTGMKYPSEKVVRETWAAVSDRATSLLSEMTKAGDVLQGSIAMELGSFLIEVDDSDGGLIGRDDRTAEEDSQVEAFFDSHYSHAASLVAAVEEFTRLANEFLETLPESRRGPKANQKLWYWLQDLKRLWEDVLGRKYTRDVDDSGEPISEAARFVAIACEPTPHEKTAALNMMKKVISRAREINIH